MTVFMDNIKTPEFKNNGGSRIWMRTPLFKSENKPGQSLLEGIESHGTTQLQQTNKMVEAKTRGSSKDSGEAVE